MSLDIPQNFTSVFGSVFSIQCIIVIMCRRVLGGSYINTQQALVLSIFVGDSFTHAPDIVGIVHSLRHSTQQYIPHSTKHNRPHNTHTTSTYRSHITQLYTPHNSTDHTTLQVKHYRSHTTTDHTAHNITNHTTPTLHITQH